MPIKQDLNAVAAGLEGGLKDILNQLIDGTISDLDGPIREVSQRLAIAVRRKRQDLVEESRDQLVLLVMEKELRLRHSSVTLLDTMLGLGLNALVNGAIAGLTGLRAV